MAMIDSLFVAMEGRSDGRDGSLNVYGSKRELVLEYRVEIHWLAVGEYWVRRYGAANEKTHFPVCNLINGAWVLLMINTKN
jgi:hypothetical protein